MKTLKNLLRNIIPLVLLAMILAAPSGCSRSETATIAAVEGRSVTIETATGHRKTHEVAPTAKITLDGKRVNLPDLQTGDKAEVITQQEGFPEHPHDVAVLIDAQRAEKDAAAGAGKPAALDEASTLSQEARPAPAAEKSRSRFGEGAPAITETPRPVLQDELSIVPADEPRADVLYEGEISFVGEDLVRLRNFAAPVQLASELTFTVTGDTEILIYGKEAVIDDLRQGMTVTIAAVQHGEVLVAKRIEAGPTLL